MNIVELRDQLIDTLQDLKSGKIDHKTAKEINNGSGKIMTTVKTQLEYAKLHKKKVKIDFMNDN